MITIVKDPETKYFDIQKTSLFNPNFVEKIEDLQNCNFVISFSSGLESVCLLYFCLNVLHVDPKQISLVYFKYSDESFAWAELQAAKIYSELTKCELITKDVNIREFKRKKDGLEAAETTSNYFPLRNSKFIIECAEIAEKKYFETGRKGVVLLGANLSESMVYPDNTQNFIYGIGLALYWATKEPYTVGLAAPFINLTKTNMLEYMKPRGVNLKYSISCYSPVYKDGKFYECKKCGSCILKQKALERSKFYYKERSEDNEPQ